MNTKKLLAAACAVMMGGILGAACGDDSADGATGVCADVACENVPAFSTLAWDTCTSCHAADAATRSANGVPDDSDYTTHAGAAKRAKDVAARVADGTMPPGISITQQEKDAFVKWGCCDAPH